MRFLLYVYLAAMFFLNIFSAYGASQLIELKSNYQPSALDIRLSADESRWLARNNTLIVGTW